MILKFKREIIAIILIICMLFTISAISAADCSTDTVSVTNVTVNAASGDVANDNNLATENDGKILAVADAGDITALRNKIAAVDAEGTVYLENDYSIAGYASISKSITIDGQGHTIDGKGSYRAFYMSTSGINVVFKNITFTNCKATSSGGGAIWSSTSNKASSIEIINCTFKDNVASGVYGGAVYLAATNYVKVINSTFTGNKATGSNKYAGAAYIAGSPTNCEIINSTFENNAGTGTYGGAVYLYTPNNVNIFNVTFRGNNATGSSRYGGAIYIGGSPTNCEIVKSTFINNLAYSGALYISGKSGSDYLIDECNFIDNKATQMSSAIYVSNANINVNNSVFLNNDMSAIYISSSTYNANNNWWGNTEDDFNSPKYSLYSGKKADDWLFLKLETDDSTGTATISLNNLYSSGSGETSAYNGKLPSIEFNIAATNINVDKNTVKLDNEGKATFHYELIGSVGYLSVSYNDIELTKVIKDLSFTSLKNKIINSQESTVYLDEDFTYDENKDSTLSDGIDFAKSITIDGQGHTLDAKKLKRIFYINDPTKDVVLKNINFVNGNADVGGAINAIVNSLTLINCTFTNNTANTYGGAIALNANTGEITENTFTNNAGSSVIYFSGNGNYNIHDSIINAQNIAVDGENTATINANYNWWGNTADNYATSIVNVGSSVTRDNWLFLNMTTDDKKGLAEISLNNLYTVGFGNSTYSAYALPEITLNISSSNAKINKNNVKINKTGKSSLNYVVKTTGSLTVSYNEEIGLTKDVTYDDDGNFKSLYNLITNIAEEGDTIELKGDYNYDSSTDSQLVNNMIIKKTLVIDGKGHTIDAKGQTNIFKINEVEVTFKNINFVNGYSSSGGAIYYYAYYKYQYCDSEIINCTFINNVASDYGGAVYNYYNLKNIIKCTFINNSVINGGSVVHTYGKTMDISNSIFVGNAGGDIIGGSTTVTANNNWWGHTVDNYATPFNIGSTVTANNWYVLNMSVDISTNAELTLNNLYDGNGISIDNNYALPAITFNTKSTNTQLTKDNVTLNAGEGNIEHTFSKKYSITASYNGIELTKSFVNIASFTELKTQINDATDELVLDQNYAFNPNADNPNDIIFSKSLTIDGAGFTIDAKGLSNIFYFNDDTNTKTLILKNIIFANATGENGAAVYFNGNRIEIVNCTFINNTANSQGAAIYVNGANNNVENKIVQSTFINNTCDNSIIYLNSAFNDASFVVSDSVIVNNTGVTISKGTGNVNADYNWWGNNATNYNINIANAGEGITIEKWFYLNITVDDEIKKAEISLNNLNDGSDYSYALPELIFDISAVNANSNKNKLILDSTGKGTVDYSFTGLSGLLTASYNGAVFTKEIKFIDKGDFDSLQEILNLIPEGKMYKLTRDYTYSENDTITTGILIDKRIAINGNGFTIDAKGKSRIFNIVANGVYLKNINFINGSSVDFGGAIYCPLKVEPINIENCTFINNTATDGGAIYSKAYDDMGYILNSKFINNTATTGSGAIFNYGDYGDIDKCIFINNTGNYIINQEFSYDSVSNSIFVSNTASENILKLKTTSKSYNNWFGNTFDDYNIPVGSGYDSWLYLKIRFYDDYAIISLNNLYSSSSTSSSIISNYGLPEITLNINSTTLDLHNVKNITLDSNGRAEVPYSMIGDSGALTVSYKDISLTKERIVGDFDSLQDLINKNDKIELDRDYTYISGVDEITEGIIINKNITIDGGKGHTIDAKEMTRIFNVQALNVTFKNIIFANGKSNLDDTSGKSNDGGAIYYNLDNTGAIEFNVDNCTFVNNTAIENLANKYQGGAIYINSNEGVFNIKNSVFIKNTAAGDFGGAIYFNTKDSKFNLYNSSFFGNTAVYNGAVYIKTDNGETTIDKCLFKENALPTGLWSSLGSAIILDSANENGNNVVKNSIFIDNNGNSAKNNKFAFLLKSGTVTLDDNWWGTTTNNNIAWDSDYTHGITPNTWLFINSAVGKNKLQYNETTTIKYSLQSFDGTNVVEFDNSKLPEFEFDVEWSSGKLSSDVVSLDEDLLFRMTDCGSVCINSCFNNQFYETWIYGPYIAPIVDVPYIMYAGHYLNKNKLIKTVSGNYNGITVSCNSSLINPNTDVGIRAGTTEGTAKLIFTYDGSVTNYDAPETYELVVKVFKVPLTINVTNLASREITLNITDTLDLDIEAIVDKIHKGFANAGETIIDYKFDSSIISFTHDYYSKTDDPSYYATGHITAKGGGTTNLTICLARLNTDKFKCENYTIKITVNKIPTEITIGDQDSFKVDDTSNLNAIFYSNGTQKTTALTYESSDENVIKFTSDTGDFKAVGEGMATLTVTFNSNSTHEGSSKSITVSVSKYTTETTVTSDKTLELEIDDESQITATLTAEDGQDLALSYESSNEAVATVDSTGKITAVGEGTATITAKFDETTRYVGSSDTVTVTVSKISTVITLTSDSEVTIDVFADSQITAALTPSAAGSLSYKSSNESVATVDADGKITAVAGGKANITISFAGDDDRYAAAEDVNVSVTANKLPTTITVNPTNDVDVFDFKSLGATVDNGRTLHYVSLNPDIVTVDDAGVITGVIGGTGIINITFAEDGQYQAKYATVTVTVNKIASTIDVNPIEIDVFESQLIGPTIVGDGAVSYVSCEPAIVTVNATNGNITGVKGGKANVTISIAEGTQYLAKEVNVTVTVKKLPTTITVNPTITVDVDGTNTIEATADHGRALEFVSLDEYIVKVDSATGVITGVIGGTANVTVKFHEDGQYLAKEVNVTVTVNKLTPTITVDPIAIDVFEDKLISPIVVSDGAVTYVSSNPSIVTVDENTGEITGVIGGKANVTIKVSETPRYEAKDANVTVTVNKLPTIITVEPTMRLKMGDNNTIVATVISGADIHYQTVSDLITVNATGFVKAIKGGIAEVTISVDATDKYQANSTTVTVTVARLPDDDTPIEVSVFSQADVSALYNFGGDPSNLKYISSNETIFTVTDEGILEAKVGSEANLTIKDEILGESVTIKVIVNKLDTPFEVNSAISINVYQTDDLGVKIPQNANKNQLRYESSNPDVVSVDENGLITGIIGGTATITISYLEDGQFVANSTDVAVTVNKLATTITINESEFSLFVDGKDVINATTNNEGGLYYASNSPSVLIANNVVTGVSEGTAEIKVIALENEKYLAKTEIVRVTVKKVPSVITVDSSEFTIDVDGNATIGAILNHEGDLTYKYNESIVSVENGIVTGIIGGKTNITISYAGDNKYSAAEDVNVSVTVNKLPTTIIVEPTISVDADGTNTINATADGRTLEFISLDETIVTVDENGLITGIKGGQANVTVRFQETDKYLGDEVNVTVTVNRLTSTISAEPIDIDVFESQLINPIIISDGVVSYVSCDPTIVTVNATNGNITAVKGGKVNITIKVAESDKYMANEVNVTVTVNKLPTVIVVNSTVSVDYGKTAVIDASADGRILEFVSLDEAIVTVDENGLITAVKGGVANVTVKFTENDYYLGDEVNVTVTVNKLATVIVVNSTIDVDYGKTAVIDASADGRILEFVSLDEAIVTVDENGLITAVKGGVANVTVKFTENDYYLGDEVNVTVTVNRLPIKISISDANNVIVGGTSTIVLTINETDATGFAIIYVNGTEYPINIYETKSLDVVLDKVGDYDVYAIYQGDDKYQTSESNPETVKAFPKYENAISVNVTENIRVGDKVEIKASSESGVIDVYVDGVKQADSEGKVVIDSLSAGQHTIKLESNETDKYVANSTEFTIDVVKKQSNIVIDIEGDLIADSNIKINIEYNGSNLVVYMDGEPLDYELKATAGNHLIVASLSEDDEYYGTTETYNFTVSKKPSEIYVSGTTVTVGESTLIKVEDLPNDATGIVVINLNGTKYSMNITENKTLSVVLDKAGNYKLSAQYLGDDKYLPSDEYVGNDILAKDKKINAIEVQYPDVIYAGDDVNVTITSDGDALEVYLDGVKQTLKDGILAIENISSGTHVLEVISQETSQFKLNSTSRVIDVAKKQAEITIDDIIGVKAGDNVAIVVTTDSDSSVVIYVDGVKLQSNIIEDIAAGSHTVIASVEETDLYLKATANRTFTVDKLPASIEVNASNVTQGQATEITVTADVDEGVVVVKLNETEVAIDLAKGKSTTVVLDTPGIYEVRANYLGNDKYESAAAASFIIEVFEKATPEVNVTIPEIKAGEDGKVNISIPNATGEVHVIIDGVDNIIPLNENGTADFTIPEMGAGNHSVVIVYPGDDTHEAKVVTQTVNVEKQMAEANITSPSDVKEGESATVKVEIANATGEVVIIVDGVEEKVPLVNGTIDYPLDNLSAGNHSVVVIYPGDDTHSSTYSSSSFNVEAEPVVVKLATELTNITIADDLNITAYLVDENGKPVANAEIIYRIGDETKYINTAEDGSFTINGVAKSKVTIDYAGNETLLATNTSITLQNVVTPPKLGSYFNVSEGTTFETYAVETAAGEKGALYAFTLRDSNGDPIVNATVTFAYKTVVFNSTTNENGTLYLGISTYLAQDALCAMSYVGDEKHNATFVAFNFKIMKKPTVVKAYKAKYKVKTTVKKYTVTLKTYKLSSRDGKVYLKAGKVLKIKVNGRNFYATTNSKGQATFKITNLNKKGVYIAKVIYAGSDTYAGSMKKVKITVY